MIMRNSNRHQEDHQETHQQQEQYQEQHKSTLVIMSMKSQTQSVNLKNKENSTAIMRKQFTPISDISSGSFSSASVAGSIQDDNMSDQCSLTQAGLEEYNSRSFFEQAVFHHQKQSSYAQSEGYHSYVSSSDSSSATPFLDRLRQESDLLSRQSHHWSQNDLSTATPTITATQSVTTNGNSNAGTLGGEQHHLLHNHHHHYHHHHHNSANNANNNGNSNTNNSNTTNNSSESHSSTETLKWLGSMSDVSEASHATGYSAISGSVSSSQLIVHSSRVLTPKRHHSESVLYMNNDQQLSPTLSVSDSLTNMPTRTSPCGSGSGGSTASSGAIYMSHHPSHYISQTSPTSSAAAASTLTKGAVAVSASSPTLLFPTSNHTDQLNNKSTLSVTISGAPSPNTSATGIGPAIANDAQSQTLHQSLLSIVPSSPSLSPSSPPLQQSSSTSPTLSMTSLSVVAAVTSASSSPSSSSSSFSSSTSGITPTSSSSYRNNHRLFPVSTYTEPVNNTATSGPPPNAMGHVHHHHHHHQHGSHQQASPQMATTHPQQQQQQQQQQHQQHHYPGNKLHSPQPTSWQSVADRINDFERQQQHLHHHHHHQPNTMMQKYTFIDPSKTHRVSNPALKAFQKNAVQSYFERQQQQSKENLKHSASGNNLLRPHSFQPTGSTKEFSNSALIRNSLPNSLSAATPRNSGTTTNHHQQLSTQISNDVSMGSSSFPDCGSSPPPPPPPRSRSLMPVRRSSSASEYAEFRDQYHRAATQEKLKAQSIKNVTQPEKMSFNDCGMPPPPPPPRSKASMPVRRTSSASEYAAMREKAMQQVANSHQQLLQRQQSMAMVPMTAVDEWVPERPPKNPNLRIPSPDLPPPPALVTVDIETNLSNQDEPLPPPPPEILRQPSLHMLDVQKPPSPNRRNSFAGSPSRKAFFNALPPPPTIPKKPTNMDLLHSRPVSSMAQQQSNKAHKIMLNEKLSAPMPGDHKSVMVARKRPHNPAVIPPIPENSGAIYNNNNNSGNSNPNRSPSRSDGLKSSPPPPLKPRMPISSQGQPIAISSKIRCNSKASYLPRQSLEKLNTTDPDHGSYKLTLTSNEDCVVTHHHNNNNNNNSNKKSDLINGGNKCNNLPDVLPVGVKLQPSSPTSAIGTSPRYGSNNSIAPSTPTTTPNYPPPPYPNMKMFISKPPLPNSRHSSPVTTYPSAMSSNGGSSGFNRSQSYDASSPKYMSQSTIDLKKTQILETPEEVPSCHAEKTLSPAQSESNINSSYTPRKEFKDYHRSEVVRKLSLEEREPGEGRIVRAELVNATLSTSEQKITRKDSLRENIEKITQLQSKLMSAHMSEASDRKVIGYPVVSKPMQSPSPKMERETKEVQTQKSEETDIPPSPLPPALPSTPQPNELEAISQMEPATDGLKLMQRTEIILRVNPITNEVGSQTDELLDLDVNRLKLIDSRDDALQRTTLQPRQKHPIELECDDMVQELVGFLPENDRLLEILVPQNAKTPADYVGKLFNPNVPLRPAKRDVGTSTPSETNGGSRFELQFAEIEVSLTNGTSEGCCDRIMRKKENLIKQLSRKLGILNTEQATIAEESSINDELGISLAVKVTDKLRPIDATKFRTYIDDVGHITSLLLSLSGRLAKAENSLTDLSEHNPERKILVLKRDRLAEQLEEAKRLKEDIDRRGSSVASLLEKNLTTDEFADYDYFINMKAKLIADSRDIADKIKFSEEQLSALNDALIQSDC